MLTKYNQIQPEGRMLSVKKILTIITIFLLSVGTAYATGFTGYRLLKISAADQRAVVKQPDGSLRVIGIGDEIDGAQVTEVAEGRVVLSGKDAETIIVRFEHGKQRIETYQRNSDQSPAMTVPETGDKKAIQSGSPNIGAGK